MAHKTRTGGTEISAGGVAFREHEGSTEVALISVGKNGRWQLPKGTVDEGESTEETALREVREEAGIRTEVIALLEKIEYWYFTGREGKRVRHHKFVFFYLLRYLDGDPADHDDEVNEACWVEINAAYAMLTFENEKRVLDQARQMIAARVGDSTREKAGPYDSRDTSPAP